MTNVISFAQLKQFQQANTRSIDIGGGETRAVRLTPYYWTMVEWIEIMDGHTIQDLAAFALEEVELQSMTFQDAFRCVVAFLAANLRDFLDSQTSRRYDTAVGPRVVTLSAFDWELVEAALASGAYSETFLLNQALIAHANDPEQEFSGVFFNVVDDYCYGLSEANS